MYSYIVSWDYESKHWLRYFEYLSDAEKFVKKLKSKTDTSNVKLEEN